ncbi:hypothetical protein ACJMK2_034929 [Sinanodonta woodiana]|uniref:NTR domain-containing protein n=1 Tax=Sinanodonta woodiana TaxID=1069815 RepID=A0ABD3WVC2_SINWO
MSTMFLQFLLVLLVAIHATLACLCKPMTLSEAMCSSTTVVLARVSDGQPHKVSDVAYRRYLLNVSSTLREDDTKMSMNDRQGALLFPEAVSDCGGILTDGLDYVIAGSVDSNGELVSASCFYHNPYEYLANDAIYMKILIGQLDCKDVSMNICPDSSKTYNTI